MAYIYQYWNLLLPNNVIVIAPQSSVLFRRSVDNWTQPIPDFRLYPELLCALLPVPDCSILCHSVCEIHSSKQADNISNADSLCSLTQSGHFWLTFTLHETNYKLLLESSEEGLCACRVTDGCTQTPVAWGSLLCACFTHGQELTHTYKHTHNLEPMVNVQSVQHCPLCAGEHCRAFSDQGEGQTLNE